MIHFPELMSKVIRKHENQLFKPTGLVVRTMKRRWGSCSNKGVITLSTELIKMSDLYIEYVIAHDLCHLKHHNHGEHYYKLLSEVFPEWKKVRREMRKYMQQELTQHLIIFLQSDWKVQSTHSQNITIHFLTIFLLSHCNIRQPKSRGAVNGFMLFQQPLKAVVH